MLEWLRENYMDDLMAYQESTAIEDVKVLYTRVAKMMDELVHRKDYFLFILLLLPHNVRLK